MSRTIKSKEYLIEIKSETLNKTNILMILQILTIFLVYIILYLYTIKFLIPIYRSLKFLIKFQS